MKKIIRKIIFVLLILLIFYVVISYAKVEVLTYKYGDQFTNEYQQTGNIIPYVDYFKVMEFSPEYASVYYIIRNRIGILYEFHKEDDRWVMLRWDTIWSSKGNADGFIWPYYR